MAKQENTETKAETKARKRDELISRLIKDVAHGCSLDMDEHTIAGRVQARLEAWGASEDEVQARYKEIKEVVKAECAQRVKDKMIRAATRDRNTLVAIQNALSGN